VPVRTGGNVGGSFRNIPTCRSASQTGCVIAYSTFGSPPPASAFFGRPGRGVSLQSGQTATTGQQVACVNPVTFSAQPGAPCGPTSSASCPNAGGHRQHPMDDLPRLYTAQCERVGGATWPQVTTDSVPADPRPTLSATLGPSGGTT